MQFMDIVERAETKCSPIVFIPKHYGTFRLCVDNGKADTVSIRYLYTMAQMKEFINSIDDETITSTLDASRRYWKVDTSEMDRDETTITFHRDLFFFESRPIGLENWSGNNYWAMEVFHWKISRQFALVYLHGTIIFSLTPDKQITHI